MEWPAVTHIHSVLEKYTKTYAFLMGKLGSPMLSHPMLKAQNTSVCSSCNRLAAIVPEWLDRLDLLHEPRGLPFCGGGSRKLQYDFRSQAMSPAFLQSSLEIIRDYGINNINALDPIYYLFSGVVHYSP